jgi:hypothetical protein
MSPISPSNSIKFMERRISIVNSVLPKPSLSKEGEEDEDKNSFVI